MTGGGLVRVDVAVQEGLDDGSAEVDVGPGVTAEPVRGRIRQATKAARASSG